MSNSESPNDTVDVSNAEEARVREIVRDELSVQDEDGGSWSVYDLMDIGLTRRQALYALGLIGAGYSVTQAAISAMSESAEAAQGTGNLGTASNPLDTVYANRLGTSSEPVQSATVQSLDAGQIQVGSQNALISVAASGQVGLTSGDASVDTGISDTDATFYLALGIDDPNADAKVAGRLFWNDSAGTYHIEIVEDGTSVGDPTVNYDILRVR